MKAQSTKLESFDDGLTLGEIGQRMGLTKERVRQIEVKALAKLQKRLDLRKLKHINQII